MACFDTHAHLDDEAFQADRDAVLDRARQAGIDAFLCPAVDAASSRAVVALAERYEDVYAAVGIQPNHAAEASEEDWEEICQLAARPRVVAIGETGLDRYRHFTPFPVQEAHFRQHLRLAQTSRLPVVIHCREAEPDVLRVLHEVAEDGPVAGVMHAFSGDESFAKACIALGLHVSFAGSVTYRNRKFQPLHQTARSVPDDRLLVETDSPYLVPHPLRGRQKRNEPACLIHTIQWLAELRGASPEELAAQTTANARQLFRQTGPGTHA